MVLQDDSIQSQDKSPSKEFLALVDKWADSYVKSKELPTRIMALARKEGLSDHVVRREIESALRARQVSEAYILKVMPAQLKRHYETPVLHDIDKTKKHSKHSIDLPAALPRQRNTEEEEEMEAVAQKYEAPPEDTEKEFLREENAQLKDAIKKLQQFPKAAELVSAQDQEQQQQPTMTKEDLDMNAVQFKLSISSGKDYMKERLSQFSEQVCRDLPQLQRRGWRWVRVTIEVTS